MKIIIPNRAHTVLEPGGYVSILASTSVGFVHAESWHSANSSSFKINIDGEIYGDSLFLVMDRRQLERESERFARRAKKLHQKRFPKGIK